MRKLKYVVLALVVVVTLGLWSFAFAKFPERPVTLVCPFGVGSASDTFVRALKEPLSRALGVPVVIVNVEGGGGLKGLVYAAQQPADGYTLFQFTPSHIIASVLKRSEYDLFNDFVVLGRGDDDIYALVVSPKGEFNTFKDLLEWAKKNPYALTMGGVSPMGLDEFVTRVFAKKFGINVTFVPFESGSQAFTALMGGHIKAMLYKMESVAPQVASGAVKPLLVMTPERINDPLWKDVPCVKEFGVEMYIGSFRAFAVRKGAPEEAIKVLEAAIKDAVNSPEFKEYIKKLGSIPRGGYMGPAEFAKYMEDAKVMFTEIAKEFGYLK
ncbi:MAG: tripartite tricarboxylate transporter substrate binding protein [Synergistetes bacterium]|nr:tripartite tricarboxylate transporter substrate binding protein [Synergistota bacterium]MCX8128428.1 tripartite tricarboxylate transporter substrate binding protein [Synergistota bacterium]MDW8192580.1 tripartite tricarboxylate transporter substrate binding protein [Synergistota bacterium]